MKCKKNPTKSKAEKEQKWRGEVKIKAANNNFKKKTSDKHPEGRVVILASKIFSLFMYFLRVSDYFSMIFLH